MSSLGDAFETPILRALGQRDRAEIAAAGRLLRLREGDLVYRARDASDSLFVVVSGSVELRAIRRGDEDESVVRVARRRDTFGEEALLVSAARWANARAREDAEVAELPIAVLLRAAERSGEAAAVLREQRALRRTATRDLLKTTALGRELSEDDLDLLLDAVRHEPAPRGARIFSIGDRPDGCFVVADGLVQLQTEDDGKLQVRAYLSRGDFFGDEELALRQSRRISAVALGDCQLLVVPARALSTLSDRNPGLLSRMRRLAADRTAEQHHLLGAAQERSTQHVFKDLYRMQMARALLAIDQDTCVRCGHCAWACADVHGESRLVRRGDKIVTELSGDVAHKSLMLPNSCQHCKNPVCMIDCPTGAIGRDPEGEVFIREELCTGCGACAKACPWENIRMAPRASGQGPAEVAVKCDLCRDYEGPACVQACPTESIVRLDPMRDFAEVGRLFGVAETSPKAAPTLRVPSFAFALALAIGLGLPAAVLHQGGTLVAGRGLGLFAGWMAAVMCVALAGYAIPKRAVSWWMRRRLRESAARRAAGAEPASSPSPKSRMKPLAVAHAALGLLCMAAVLAHSGVKVSAGLAGTLAAAFWVVALSGAFGSIVYRFVPRRLSLLERRGALPEDLRGERELLVDRLHRAASGKSELVKKLLERVLLPYSRSPFGWLALVLSGRSLRDEERMLEARIDRMLEGRGGDKLVGTSELVRIVVELRALPARRVLTHALRVWLPLHAILSTALLVLLLLHVVSTLRF